MVSVSETVVRDELTRSRQAPSGTPRARRPATMEILVAGSIHVSGLGSRARGAATARQSSRSAAMAE